MINSDFHTGLWKSEFFWVNIFMLNFNGFN